MSFVAGRPGQHSLVARLDRADDVPAEEDVASGLQLAEECGFLRGKFRTLDAEKQEMTVHAGEDERARRRWKWERGGHSRRRDPPVHYRTSLLLLSLCLLKAALEAFGDVCRK